MSRSDPILYVVIHAGLGNQMFQYAAGKALAKHLNCEFVLDCSAYANQSPKTARREYLLDAFRIDAPILEGRAYSPLFAALKQYKLARQFMRRQGAAGFGIPTYEEPCRPFDPELASRQLPAIIRGYWQSERYFEDIAGEIRGDFKLRDGLSENGNRVAERISGAAAAVSVHVRRGDKVTAAIARDRFGHLSTDYYRRAYKFFEDRLSNPLYVIFSDEPDVSRDIFDFFENRIIVDGRSVHPAEDITLMSLCDHHIIANSSFSWWGAWLNPHPDKIVIAPRPWYSPAAIPESDTVDLIPPRWTLLSA